MQKVKAWQTTDGRTFTTLLDAQLAELATVLDGFDPTEGNKETSTKELASLIHRNAEKVVNVLTLKDSSHPKARKAVTAPATPRKKKGAVLPEPVTAPAE